LGRAEIDRSRRHFGLQNAQARTAFILQFLVEKSEIFQPPCRSACRPGAARFLRLACCKLAAVAAALAAAENARCTYIRASAFGGSLRSIAARGPLRSIGDRSAIDRRSQCDRSPIAARG